MRQRNMVGLLAILLMIFSASGAFAVADSDSKEKDTDARLVNAKVVEVADGHVSVVAQTGVEHVIAIDRADTKVTIEGRVVSLKDVREGDLITVDLDANKKVKFAKNINIKIETTEVARNRR